MTIRCYAELNDFLPTRLRQRACLACFEHFLRCGGCGWQGSHYARLRALLSEALTVDVD